MRGALLPVPARVRRRGGDDKGQERKRGEETRRAATAAPIHPVERIRGARAAIGREQTAEGQRLIGPITPAVPLVIRQGIRQAQRRVGGREKGASQGETANLVQIARTEVKRRPQTRRRAA